MPNRIPQPAKFTQITSSCALGPSAQPGGERYREIVHALDENGDVWQYLSEGTGRGPGQAGWHKLTMVRR